MNPALASILDRSGHADTVAWAHEGRGNLAALPDPMLAIAAAAELGNTAALQSVTAPKDLRKAASAALHKLRSRGVKIEAAVAPRAFTLGRAEVAVPSRAFLSLPDLEGDLELLLTCTDGEGTCVLGVIIAGDGTVREARHAHMGRGELRDLWKQAEGRADLQELTFTAGLHFADLWLGGHDHNYKHFLEHVPGHVLAVARALEPLTTARAPIDEEDTGLDAWLAPASLLDEAAIASGTARTSDTLASPEGAGSDAVSDAIEAIVRETASAAVTDANREKLVQAAELAAIAYRFHGRVRAAERLMQAASALQGGAVGADIAPVVNTTRLALLSAAAQAFQQPRG